MATDARTGAGRRSGAHVSRRTVAVLSATVVALIAVFVARAVVIDDPLERLSSTTSGEQHSYEGSWYFPRGGPYILGFESPDADAVLAIDDRVLVRGRGLKSARMVAEVGAHRVAFEAPPGARLLWHPPGRRGPLEYVPPSSLSHHPPETASFGAGAGASVGDGIFIALLFAILAALVLYLAWPAVRRADRKTLAWAGMVLLLAAAVRLWDLGGAGQTWDEDVNWSAGRNYVTNWLSLDFSESSWQWNFQHPPVMKYVAGAGAQFADGYGPSRALSALMVAIACALLVPIGARLYSLRVGVLAATLSALTPHLIAHGKVVGHEAPSLLWWALGIWLALRAHDDLDRADRYTFHKRLMVLGVVLGLAIFSRFINGLLAPVIGVILVLRCPRERWIDTVKLGLVILPLAAMATGFLIWPRLWPAPIEHLRESWHVLRRPHSAEPFLGAMTNEPPGYYFFLYAGATAPVGILVGAALWLVRAAVERSRSTWMLLAWFVGPFVVAYSPVRQDGVRYILPALLALNIAAAAGVEYAVGCAGRWIGDRSRVLFAALTVALAGYLVVVCVRIHPFYLDYYGEQVGGPKRVAERGLFETAWWGEGIADAIAYINRHAEPGARVHKRCVEQSHLTWLRADLWKSEVARPDAADWIVSYQPLARPCQIPDDARLVYQVSAQGAPLARVYRRGLPE